MDTEGVHIGVVGWFIGSSHDVDCIARGGEEEELEDGVVDTVGEGPEEVKVPSYIDE